MSCVLSYLQLFVTPWTIACQTLLSMEFSKQEYWSGLPFLTPEDLPNPEIKPTFFTTAPNNVIKHAFKNTSTWRDRNLIPEENAEKS